MAIKQWKVEVYNPDTAEHIMYVYAQAVDKAGAEAEAKGMYKLLAGSTGKFAVRAIYDVDNLY